MIPGYKAVWPERFSYDEAFASKELAVLLLSEHKWLQIFRFNLCIISHITKLPFFRFYAIAIGTLLGKSNLLSSFCQRQISIQLHFSGNTENGGISIIKWDILQNILQWDDKKSSLKFSKWCVKNPICSCHFAKYFVVLIWTYFETFYHFTHHNAKFIFSCRMNSFLKIVFCHIE